MRSQLALWVAIPALFLTATPAFAQRCPSLHVRVTATQSHDPGYTGLYKYTLRGAWNLGAATHSAGRLFVLLPAGTSCPCICNESFARFAPEAGTSSGFRQGTGRRCVLSYAGNFACQGDPSLGLYSPAIGFEARSPGCGNASASGTWVLYSPIPPGPPATYRDAVVLQFGGSRCTGNLVGQLPDCRLCIVIGVQQQAWSVVKTLYK